MTVGPDDAERLAGYGDVANGLKTVGAALGARTRDPIEVDQAIAALVALSAGNRPLRTVVPAGSPVEQLNNGIAPLEREALEAYGFGPVLSPFTAAV